MNESITKYVQRVLVLNPFDRDQRETQLLVYQEGAALERYVEDVAGERTAVSLNGAIIPRAEWGAIAPKPEDSIVVSELPEGGGSSGILRAIALIAVAVLAIYVGGVLIAAGHAFLGALAAGGIMMGGQLLINAVLPPPTPAQKSISTTYGWSGPQMTAREGIPIPKGYGQFRSGGNVIASYVYSVQDKQYMNLLICFGHGPANAITGIKINDNDAQNFKGIVIEKRMGYLDQSPTTYFNDIINEYPESQKLTVSGGPFVINGRRTDTQALEVDFTFPKGLWNGPDSNGNINPWSVWVKVEYSPAGKNQWMPAIAPRSVTPVGTADEWVAISTDQMSGGPNSVIVHATGGSHYAGEPYIYEDTVSVYDANNNYQGTQSYLRRGVWVRNPMIQPPPGGIDTGKGGYTPVGGDTQAVTVGDWKSVVQQVTGWGGTDNPQKEIRTTVRIDGLTAGQWDIRVSKVGSGNGSTPNLYDNNNDTVGEDTYISAVREIAYDDLAYPGMVLMAVRALATDQLSGGSLNVTAVVDYGTPATAGYRNLVAEDRPQAYYRFDETSGTVAADSSGRGNNATYPAGIGYGRTGLINGSASLGIAPINTALITTPAFSLGTDWSVEFWAAAPAGANGYLFWQDANTYIGLSTNGTITCKWGGVDHPSATALVANAITHVAVTCKAGTVTFYFNGVQDANSYTGHTGFTPTGMLQVNAGIFDEVAIYAPSLSPARWKQRTIWGNSAHNVLETYRGSNPAIVTWDMMTNSAYGGGIDFSLMDVAKWKQWADYCDQEISDGNGGMMYRHTCNCIFDADGNLWDQVAKVASAAHAVVMRTGTKYTLALDISNPVPVQMFSVANVKAKSFKRNWLSMTDRANRVDISFQDETNDFKRTSITVMLPGDVEAGASLNKAQQIDLFGVTNPTEAWYYGAFKLTQNKKLLQSIEFGVDIDALACQVGDTFLFQHDVPQWGISGRCAAGSTTTTVDLDQVVTIDAGKSYELMILHPSVLRASGCTITAITGNVVSLSGYAGQAAKRLVISGGADGAILSYGNGWVELQDTSGFAVGNTCSVYDTDVIETQAVSNGAGTTAALTLTAPLAVAPAQYDVWVFGEVNNNAQLFRVTEISRGQDLDRIVKAIQYDDSVYSDPLPTVTVSPAGYGIYGPLLPAGATDSSSAGALAWSSPASAEAEDGVYTAFTNNATGAAQTSHLLLLQNFGFTLAPTDVVTGIAFTVKRKAIVGTSGSVGDASIKLVKNGVVQGTDHAAAGNWGQSDEYFSYGGDGDLWGLSWSPTDINDPNFGIAIQGTALTQSGQSWSEGLIDAVSCTVYVARASASAVSNLVAREEFIPTGTGAVYEPYLTLRWQNGKSTVSADIYISAQSPGASSYGPETFVQTVNGTSWRAETSSGWNYKIRVVGRDAQGNAAPIFAAPTAAISIIGIDALPANVKGFEVTAWSSPNVTLQWTANTESTLTGYEIRYVPNVNGSDADWDSATVVATPAANATSATASNGAGTYLIRATVQGGYQSLIASPAVAGINLLSVSDYTGDANPANWRQAVDNYRYTGAQRGYGALDSLNHLTTGTANRTVLQIEGVVGSDGRAKLLDLTSVNNGSLDNVPDGASFGKTTFNQVTGAGRGYAALDSLNHLATGTPNQTVSQIESGVGRANIAIDAGNVVVPSGIDFSRGYTGKNLGNIADDPASGRFSTLRKSFAISSSALWLYVGTWNGGDGQSLQIDVIGGAGYNSNSNQQNTQRLVVRQANANSGGGGIAPNISGASWWGWGNSTSFSQAKIAAAAGNNGSGNNWDVYLYMPAYAAGHFEVSLPPGSSFTWALTGSGIDPGTASSTLVVATGAVIADQSANLNGGLQINGVSQAPSYLHDLHDRVVTTISNSSGFGQDNVPDGSNYFRTTQNQRDGGGRGWNALNSLNELTTGTPNRTVSTYEQVVGSDGRAKYLDLASINNGSIDNVPDGTTYSKPRGNALWNGIVPSIPQGRNLCANPGFEHNRIGLVPAGTVVTTDDAPLCDDWTVTVPVGMGAFCDTGSPAHGGATTLAIRMQTGASFSPGGATGGLRVYSNLIPVRAGQVLTFGCYYNRQAQAALPAGITIGTRIGGWFCDEFGNPLSGGEFYVEDSTSTTQMVNTTWLLQQGTITVPSNAAFVKMQCSQFLYNNTSTAFSTGTTIYCDSRFDDVFLIEQSNLDSEVMDGSSYFRTTQNQRDGGGRGWNALNSLNELTTGTPNRTVSTYEQVVGSDGRAKYLDLASINNGSLDNVPDGATYGKPTFNQVTGGGRGYAALDSLNHLTTGTPNRTVSTYEQVVGSDGRAKYLDLSSIGLGTLDNIPNGSTYGLVSQSALSGGDVDPRKDGFIKRGSIPITYSGALSYTSGTNDVSWTCNIQLYRTDLGLTIDTVNGSQDVTGLATGTSYNWYPFIDENTLAFNMVATGGVGTPAWAHSGTNYAWTQEQARSDHFPLSQSPVAAGTTTSGTGGGSGGGSGTCPRADMKVMHREHGLITAGELADGFTGNDWIRWRKSWVRVVRALRRPNSLWIRIRFNCGHAFVGTPNHSWTTINGECRRSNELTIETGISWRDGVTFPESIAIERQEADAVLIEIDSPEHMYDTGEEDAVLETHNFQPAPC